MLEGINPLLSPERLKLLCEMGHGDEIVLADANFTAESLGRGKTVLRLPGVSMREACAAVLSVFPLDDFVAQPVAYMQVGGTAPGYRSALQREVIADLSAAGSGRSEQCEPLERFSFNERVVLQAIRLQGSCPKAEIARLTHLTAQTVQIIIARLEADELVCKLAPVRGKVGQPSVPMALNPDGAFSIGVKIGRRSMDMLLVDFTGQVRERLSLDYPFPDPDMLFTEIGTRLRQLRRALKPALRERLCGIGIAAPLSLGGWNELLGIAPQLAAKWHAIDIRERMAALGATAGLPVEFVKDTAAACVAELVAGRGRSIRSFLYVFVDTFIGGGLVLDSHLSGGVTGNAGAVGSLPMGLGKHAARPPEQLLNIASLWNLEALYAKASVDVNAWTDARALAEP